MIRKISAALLAAALAGGAWAHHSFADFDRSKHMTITGTVRALEWENPHIWLWLNVMDSKGNEVPWGFEGAAPAEMARDGFDRHKIQKGDKVTVTFSPLRDGRMGGSFQRITLSNGTVLGGNNPPPVGGPPPGK